METPPIGLKLGEEDSPLVRFYHEAVAPALVYVERTDLTSGRTESGTGTIFMVQGNERDGWLPLICTASHVVAEVPGDQFEYRLCRYDFDDPLNPKERVATFRSGGKGPRDPAVFYYSGPHSSIIDIGFVRGPLLSDDGSPFLAIAVDGRPEAKEVIPIETDPRAWTAEGSRVAWAGYAALASEIASRPTPCYFEGSMSALILRKEGPLYLLDGHNTFGVSGGPVWAESALWKRPRLIGVISSYRHLRASAMPGFAHAVPIQPLWSYLKEEWNVKANLREP